MRILVDVAVVGPRVGWQDASGRTNLIAPEILDQRAAIDRICDCLTDANVPEDRVASVERHITEDCAGSLHDLKVRRVASDSNNHVGRERVRRNIGTAFAKFERSGCWVGYD